MEKTQEDRIREGIKKNYPLFKGIYDSDQEMYEYFLKFQRIYKTPEDAFYEIFAISEYYRTMKIVNIDVLKIIMIVSLIERLNSKKDFITFPEWSRKNEKESNIVKPKTVRQIFSNYEKEHGCSSKFRRFFQDFLTKKEKVELIQSIHFFPRLQNGLNPLNMLPFFCFEESRCSKCRPPPPVLSHPIINYNKDCLICNDEKELRRVLDEFAEFLYTLRSKFVHDARMFALASSESVTHGNEVTISLGLWTYIEYSFRKLKRPKYKGGIFLDLTAHHLEGILEHNFKKLLDNFVALRESEKSNITLT